MVKALEDIIAKSSSIVFFGGAGVSTAVSYTHLDVYKRQIGYDLIVPVPASGKKRGYNVPELMALPLAKAMEVPLAPQALERTRAKASCTRRLPISTARHGLP